MDSKPKVLIVEDEKLIRESLTQKLKQEGFEAIEAKDAEEGLVLAIKNKPDVILLDILMPILDGLWFLEELRKDSWGKEAPVIILTNLSEAEKVEQAMKMGVRDFLVKANWNLDQVAVKVRSKIQPSAD